jgi:hypothetical protein
MASNSDELHGDQGRPAKEHHLQEIRKEIDQITDATGRPIEPGIKEAVIMFNAHGLRTRQSCEGHSETDRVLEEQTLAPWVEVYPEEPDVEKWQYNDELREKVDKEGRELRLKSIRLLDQFYRVNDRKVPYDAMLGFDNIAYGFRIQSNGLEVLPDLPEETRNERRLLYKKEMDDFTEFLKNEYLKN